MRSDLRNRSRAPAWSPFSMHRAASSRRASISLSRAWTIAGLEKKTAISLNAFSTTAALSGDWEIAWS